MDQAPQWYAVYTRVCNEKKVAAEFAKQHIEHYLPLFTTIRKWSDRKKTLQVPLINSYLFVHITNKQYMKVLQTNGVVKILHFDGKPVPIPEYQITNLKILLGAKIPINREPTELTKGQEVLIKHGTLKGLRGNILLIKGCHKLVISINALNYNMVIDIDPYFVEPVQSSLDMKKKP
jgi:transcriptional antiterminator RfaH